MFVKIIHQNRLMSFSILGLLGMVGLLAVEPCFAQNSPAPKTSKPFMVFDGTAFRSKPVLSTYGIKRINIIYVSWFGEKWFKSPAKSELPDEKIARRLAREAFAKDSLVVIDIEHWPLDGPESLVRESLRKYRKITEWFRHEVPALRFGFFGIVPMAAYGWSLEVPGSSHYRKWQNQNDLLRPLAQDVDIIFPYLYTYYPDQRAWVTFATENIKEARRYGKPVYVFLWPKYTENAKEYANQYIPGDYWKLQLETVRQHADGLVIWGGFREEWDEHADWWRVTKEFMSDISQGQSVLSAPSSLTVR